MARHNLSDGQIIAWRRKHSFTLSNQIDPTQNEAADLARQRAEIQAVLAQRQQAVQKQAGLGGGGGGEDAARATAIAALMSAAGQRQQLQQQQIQIQTDMLVYWS